MSVNNVHVTNAHLSIIALNAKITCKLQIASVTDNWIQSGALLVM